jgi:hypothetical protein
MVAGSAVWTGVVGRFVVGRFVVGRFVVGGSVVVWTIAHLARWRALLLWRLKFERSSDPKLQQEQVCFFMQLSSGESLGPFCVINYQKILICKKYTNSKFS